MHLEGIGGIAILYKEYVKANHTIPGLPQYNEDLLFLVVPDHKYGQRVHVQIGTLVIDHLVMTITKEELQWAGDTWKQVHLSTIVSKRNTMESLNIPKYGLKGVKGKIHMMRGVAI